MVVFCCLLMMNGKVGFEIELSLPNPPEEMDLYLQNVLHVEVDTKGNYLVSDFPSARVHRWTPDGVYDGNFGRPGRGPGEFSFAGSFGPPMGQIYAVDDRIYIYDSGTRTLSIFDDNYQFLRRINLEGLGGKINTFHVLAKDRFLFYDSYFCDDSKCRRILLYDGEGKLLKIWDTTPDDTWNNNQKTGITTLYIYAPTFAVDFSPERGEAVVAHTSKPVFKVYDRAGKILREQVLKVPKPMVLDRDVKEFHDQEWMKGERSPKAVFPEERNYFDWVLTLKEGYLLYHLSPIYGRVEGYLVGFDGKLKGRVDTTVGEGGGLWSPRGQLWMAVVDDAGDFSLNRYKVSVN